jgi:hypothetical protein
VLLPDSCFHIKALWDGRDRRHGALQQHGHHDHGAKKSRWTPVARLCRSHCAAECCRFFARMVDGMFLAAEFFAVHRAR